MERREQVFVSSTFLDLRAERQAVVQTLLQADCFPAGMELFPASDDEKWDLIQRVINDSDYYVVVIGGRYGSVDDDGLSFTEKEFDHAVAVGKPVMGFVHGNPGGIPAGRTDLAEEAQARLAAFKDKIGRRMIKYWTSPSDLAGAVALSLIQTRKTHPAEGWIRAGNALTPELERELAQLRGRVASLQLEVETRETAATKAAHVDELAQGEDTYQMDIGVRYWTVEDVAAGRRFERSRRAVWTYALVTWNQLLSDLGPLMMNEAAEDALDARLDDLARAYLGTPFPDQPQDLGAIATAEVAPDVIQDIKVQFFSLGLIVKSERRHPVNDQNTYWALSEEGRNAMMRLRAQRRSTETTTS